MSQQAIVDAIYVKLTASGATNPSALVSGRIAESEGPFDESFPHILFHIISDPVDATFLRDNADIIVQVDTYGEKSGGSKAVRVVSDAIFSLLNRSTLSISGFTGGTVDGQDRGSRTTEGDAIRIMQMYRVQTTEVV